MKTLVVIFSRNEQGCKANCKQTSVYDKVQNKEKYECSTFFSNFISKEKAYEKEFALDEHTHTHTRQKGKHQKPHISETTGAFN